MEMEKIREILENLTHNYFILSNNNNILNEQHEKLNQLSETGWNLLLIWFEWYRERLSYCLYIHTSIFTFHTSTIVVCPCISRCVWSLGATMLNQCLPFFNHLFFIWMKLSPNTNGNLFKTFHRKSKKSNEKWLWKLWSLKEKVKWTNFNHIRV